MFLTHLYNQRLALMVMFDWLVEPPSMKGGWKSASIMSGVQCVITLGVVLMLQWFASSLDIHTLDVSPPCFKLHV